MTVKKKIITVSLWSLSALLLVFLLGFTSQQQATRPCEGVEVKVVDKTGNLFIEPVDIIELLNSRGEKIKGTPMSELDLGLLEKLVYSNPYVARAEVYVTMTGFVRIDVWQRNPVLRVVNDFNEHFYIDEEGAYFPVTDKYSSHVAIATGYIYDRPGMNNLSNAMPFPNDSTVSPVMVQLNEIAWFLKRNDLWDAQIEQIYVNEQNDIEMIPRVGNHSIVIGNTHDLELKMHKLMIFYQEAVSRAGWDKYSVINLKFRNQVIGTRSNG
jgi:cell division protein FtsQ